MLLLGATFVPFHYYSISSYDYTMNYPSVTGHLGVPQFAFMNNAAMNILLFPVEHL